MHLSIGTVRYSDFNTIDIGYLMWTRARLKRLCYRNVPFVGGVVGFIRSELIATTTLFEARDPIRGYQGCLVSIVCFLKPNDIHI